MGNVAVGSSSERGHYDVDVCGGIGEEEREERGRRKRERGRRGEGEGGERKEAEEGREVGERWGEQRRRERDIGK